MRTSAHSESVNICILTIAAELPWSNCLIERYNAIIGYTVTKKSRMLFVSLNLLYHGQCRKKLSKKCKWF